MRIRTKTSQTPRSWSSKTENADNSCGKSSTTKLNGNRYKKLFKSLAGPSNGSTAEEKVAKESLSPLKKHRFEIVDCNPEKQFSEEIAEPCQETNSDSEAKDANKFLEWENTQSNDIGKKQMACSVCQLGGVLLQCDGKGCSRRFHLYCVDPPFTFAPPGVWHCIHCVERKIKIDVHSVSEGPDYVVDTREVDLENEVVQKEKQYLVKYKGLAHVHNRWIPERELKGKPKSLLKLNKYQAEGSLSKSEWTVPHRLLQKRKICMAKKDILDCENEWLVKWKGLDHDRATWELETASFLQSPEAFRLIRDFENRHFAKRVEDEERETPSNGIMIESPYKGPAGLNSQHEEQINELRKCWFKRQSSVLFENEEKFAKVVLFILSLKENTHLPFLIIAPTGIISAWEAEFSRHESSNIVVYKGNSDVRSCIRALEFYNENDCIMFQVLLTNPYIVLEDLSILADIKWGGVIVDDCQRRLLYDRLNKIKALKTDIRILIANDHIMNQRRSYNKLLSFISSEIEGEKENDSDWTDSDESDPDDDIEKLKEKLASFVAYKCKYQDPGFSEYWVPVMLSNVQLEKYCDTLLSKSVLLCSSQRNDLSSSLQELLGLQRECCDHPYLVDFDHSLRRSLTKDLNMAEHLDAEIDMSGKLQLLDKCLLLIKQQNLRVVIIFQPCVGPGKISIGDILDDFVLQRFGKDSYVRLSGENTVRSKKKAVLKSINNEVGTHFVFLIERRSCIPSIKLSSIDTVILFDSDWDPLNDLKALRKISFQSHSQQLKIFRLYSIHTVEEMVLILAKQGLCPDNLKIATRRTCNKLLTWGALHQFDKLDQFHAQNDSNQIQYSENNHCLLHSVVSEFSALLSNTNLDTKVILKVQQTKGAYVNNVSPYGEVEAESGGSIYSIQKLMQNESSMVYWTNILKGRSPRWKFLSSSLGMVIKEQTEKKPGKNADSIDETAGFPLIQWMKKKRRLFAEGKGSSSAGLEETPRKDSSSAGLEHPACKKTKSVHAIQDKKAGSNGKVGFSSKTKKAKSVQDKQDKKAFKGVSSKTKRADCILKKRVPKRNPPLEKRTTFGKAHKLIIRELPASDLIATTLTTYQKHTCSPQGSKRQLPQVPKYPSLVDSTVVDDLYDSSTFLPPIPAQLDQCLDIPTSVNISESFPSSQSMENQVAFSNQLPQSNHVPQFDNTSTFLPLIPSKIDQCLDGALSVDITKSLPSSHNKKTLLSCNTQLQLEVTCSTLLEPQPRDMEIIEKIMEQASKIKQDTKSKLRAEFEKEIDQVTKKYIKILEAVGMELSQRENELESYYKKVNESKSMVQAFSEKLDSVGVAKSSRAQQGAKRSNQQCKNSITKSLSTTSTKSNGIGVSLSSHFPPVPYHAVPTNAVPIDTTQLSPALQSPSLKMSTYGPQIPHRGTFKPVTVIRTPAPHLRGSCPCAEVSSLEYSKTHNGTLIRPRLSSNLENTPSPLQKVVDVSSLSTSELMSQLFSSTKLIS